jgi:hypothetical protein
MKNQDTNYGLAVLYLHFLCESESVNAAKDLAAYKGKTMLLYGSLLICAVIQASEIRQ